MSDLSKSWPLGLNRGNWWRYALGLAVGLAALFPFDATASHWAQGWPPAVVAFFRSITVYGLSDWILIPSFTLFAASGLLSLVMPGWTRRVALVQATQMFGFIFVGVGLPGLASNLLKRIIGRGRPSMFDEAGAFSFRHVINEAAYQSFPSGHATTAMASAFVVGFLVDRWFPPALVFGVAIVLSRVAVGAHYPSDVVAGAVMGTLGAYLVRNLFAARRWVFVHGADGRVALRKLSPVLRLGALRRRKAQPPAPR